MYRPGLDESGNPTPVETPDLRGTEAHTDTSGSVHQSVRQHVSKVPMNWTTFKDTGDDSALYVSCPAAAHWNEKCITVPITGTLDPSNQSSFIATITQVSKAASDYIKAVVAGGGCPVHNPPAPAQIAPSAADQALAAMAAAQKAAAISQGVNS